MNSTATAPKVGDLVWGRAWADGSPRARRKGLVVRDLTGVGSPTVAVWWYGMGAPDAGREGCPHVQAMFAHELTRAGDFSGASVRQLGEWERGLAASHLRIMSDAQWLGQRLHRLRTKLLAIARDSRN